VSKILFFLLIAVAVYILLRARGSRTGAGQSQTERTGQPEAVVACSHCGVHVPISEVIVAEGANYCCEEHRRLGHD